MADEVPEQIPAGQPDKSDGEEKSSDKEPAPMKKGPKVKATAKAKAKADAKSKAKASAKNKAVVSAKAKAKAKAKAAPKASICKRPSMAAPKTPMKKKPQKSEPSAPVKPSKSNKDEEKPDQKNKDKGMKRPSSKNEPEKRNLFGGLPDDKPDPENEDQNMEEGEEEEEFEDDMEIEDKAEDIKEEKKTDRCKKQKFLAMLAGNQLPDFVKKQWEGTKAMRTGRTEAQRSIINAAFDRSTAGKLILSLEKPVFQSARAQYQDKSSSSIEKSLPKTLFCGKFNLSPELFQEGLAAGDFQQVDVGGRAQYVWASSESKITKGDRSEVGLKAEIQGKKDDGAKFDAMLKKDWSKGLLTQGPANAAQSAGSGRGQLALMDKQQSLTDEQWNAAQGQLLPAMQAFEKCEKDGLKHLQVVGNDSKDDPLYTKLQLGWPIFFFTVMILHVLIFLAGISQKSHTLK